LKFECPLPGRQGFGDDEKEASNGRAVRGTTSRGR
jgi:hypothetical protein